MKQLVQDLRNGSTYLATAPAPSVKDGHLLIQSHYSLVSPGTERMLVSFGRASWLQKARQQPEKVQQVFEKIKKDGLKPTIASVQNKLDKLIPLGYCNVGKVLAVGSGVEGYSVGDRVISNGQHAEVVCIPKNLCAKVPSKVSDEEAVFTVMAAIALQGIRLSKVGFGDTVVVMGLGLIGQLAVRLLLVAGCKVIATDLQVERLLIAENAGAKVVSGEGDFEAFVKDETNGSGADAVLICTATDSNEVMSQAAKASRKRGQIILIGTTGLQLNRADFYEKELSFQVSCSYGPGRYDTHYEQKGRDYPIGFVRWTEQRNFEAVLAAMERGSLEVKDLISTIVPFEGFEGIYNDLEGSNQLAALLKYNVALRHDSTVVFKSKNFTPEQPIIGIIGAGAFTESVLLPTLKNHSAQILVIASANGLSAGLAAKKYGIAEATSDYQNVLAKPEINTVIITTRHHLHATMAITALEAGKHVFVEKPLALSIEELEAVMAAANTSHSILHVGFNRRFSSLALQMQEAINGASDTMLNITVNAGPLPPQHWLLDNELGGGRLIGEACHFIDLAVFLCQSHIARVSTMANGNDSQNFVVSLQMANGALASIQYFANGATKLPKETITAHSQGKTMVLDNWRKLTGYGFKNFKNASTKQDKGFDRQMAFLLHRIAEGGNALIPLAELENVSRATILAKEAMGSGGRIVV